MMMMIEVRDFSLFLIFFFFFFVSFFFLDHGRLGEGRKEGWLKQVIGQGKKGMEGWKD